MLKPFASLIILLALLAAFSSNSRAQTTQPPTTEPEQIDFRRAQELYQKSTNGDPLTDDEKNYLNKAKAAIAAGHRPGPDRPNRPDVQRPQSPRLNTTAPATTPGPYAITNTLKIGGEGLWGRLTLDDNGKFLYIPRTGKTQVVDTASGKIVAEIPIPPGPASAVALVPDANRGFITNARDNSVTIFDLKTNTVLGTVHVADDPSAICYDPSSKRLFIACRGGRSVVPLAPDIDTKSGKPGDPISLEGKPSALVTDSQGSLYVTIEDTAEIALIDTKESSLLAKWPIGHERGPGALEGLSIDPKTNRLFIGDRAMRAVVLSAVDGHQVAEIPLPSGADTTVFADNHAFAICFDGSLAVIGQNPQGTFELQQTINTGLPARIPGARTLAIDPKTSTLYLATMDLDPTQEGSFRPLRDSFKILVIQKK